MNPELTLIGVWDGDYIKVIGILVEVNPELKVRIKRKKLIIKGESYYRCVPIGEKIEVPKIYQ